MGAEPLIQETEEPDSWKETEAPFPSRPSERTSFSQSSAPAPIVHQYDMTASRESSPVLLSSSNPQLNELLTQSEQSEDAVGTVERNSLKCSQ